MIALRQYTRSDIRKIVKRIVKRYNTKDHYKLCEYLDVNIWYYDMPPSFLGCQIKIFKTSNVTLNLKKDSFTNNFTLCHELGHHILRHDVNVNGMLNTFEKRYIADGIEFEANCFVVELLGCNTEFNTENEYLSACGSPLWARRYVDWKYVKGSRNINKISVFPLVVWRKHADFLLIICCDIINAHLFHLPILTCRYSPGTNL